MEATKRYNFGLPYIDDPDGWRRWCFSRALKGKPEPHAGATEILSCMLIIEEIDRGYVTGDRGSVGA